METSGGRNLISVGMDHRREWIPELSNIDLDLQT